MSGSRVALSDKERGPGLRGNCWRGIVVDTENPIVEPAGSALVAAHVADGVHSCAIVRGMEGSAPVMGGFQGILP